MTLRAAPTSATALFRKLAPAFYQPVLVAAAYYLSAHAAFYVGTLSDRIFAPFWPPPTILFWALLFVPMRRWWLFILAVAPAHIAAEHLVEMPGLRVLTSFITNCTIASVSAYAVRRWAPGPPWFVSVRQTLIYFLITAGICPALCAFIAALGPVVGGAPIDHYGAYWLRWFGTNALAGAALSPVLLTWRDELAERAPCPPRKRLEALAIGIGLMGACLFAFGAHQSATSDELHPTLLYLPAPFLVWAALRFGACGASSAIVIVTAFAAWGALRGSPFFDVGSPEQDVLALQVFLIALSIPAFLLGAAVKELHLAQNDLRELTGSLISMQDAERRQISRNLHEYIGQDLVAGHLLASRMERETGPALALAFEDLRTILKRAIEEIKAVSQLLYPPLLDDSGLALALKAYAKRVSTRSGVDVEMMLSPELGQFPRDMEMILFRAIQEVLTKVHRYSGSAATRVALTRATKGDEELITITVEDGAEESELADAPQRIAAPQELPGAGLVEISERLRQIGGSIQVKSTEGKTLVTVLAPSSRLAALPLS